VSASVELVVSIEHTNGLANLSTPDSILDRFWSPWPTRRRGARRKLEACPLDIWRLRSFSRSILPHPQLCSITAQDNEQGVAGSYRQVSQGTFIVCTVSVQN
jgi:hypothetical protein